MNNKRQHTKNVENNLPEFVPGHLVIPIIANPQSIHERMAAYHIPGVSVAVIENYQVEWAQGYGVLKCRGKNRVTRRSLFQACSTSKMLAAAIVLRLVEQGLLDLDEDVNTYIQSWQIPKSELTQGHKVTLRLLLSHQSGINRPDGGFDWEAGSQPTLTQILRGEHPAKVPPAFVEYVPGIRWQYANFGYIIIQLILEEVLCTPFTQIAEEMVFNPLGMMDSTFKYPLEAGWSNREITLHNQEGEPTCPGMIPSAVAHGGLITTPTDLARFGIALMKAYHGYPGPLLSASMVRQMFQLETWVDDTSIFGFPFGQGLGVFLARLEDQRIIFHPGGNDPGASCLLLFLPDSGQGTAIMTNGLNGLSLTVEFLSAIAHDYHWGKTQQ